MYIRERESLMLNPIHSAMPWNVQKGNTREFQLFVFAVCGFHHCTFRAQAPFASLFSLLLWLRRYHCFIGGFMCVLERVCIR